MFVICPILLIKDQFYWTCPVLLPYRSDDCDDSYDSDDGIDGINDPIVFGGGMNDDHNFLPTDKSDGNVIDHGQRDRIVLVDKKQKALNRLGSDLINTSNVRHIIGVIERNDLIVFSELMNGSGLNDSIKNTKNQEKLSPVRLVTMTLNDLEKLVLPKIQRFSSQSNVNLSRSSYRLPSKSTSKGAILKHLSLFNYEVFDLKYLTKLLMDRTINIEVFRSFIDALYDICVYVIGSKTENQEKVSEYQELVNEIFYKACGEFNRYDIAQFLLEKERTNQYIQNSVNILNINWQNKEIDDGYGNVNLWTPLINASLNGNASIVELLCQYKDLDINYRDFSGFSALSHAFLYPHIDCYVILRNYGALHLNQLSNDGHDLDPSDFVLDEKHAKLRLARSRNAKIILNSPSSNNTGLTVTNANVSGVDENKHSESDIAIDIPIVWNESDELFATKRQYIEQILSYYLQFQRTNQIVENQLIVDVYQIRFYLNRNLTLSLQNDILIQ